MKYEPFKGAIPSCVAGAPSLIDLVFNNSSLTEDKEVSEGYYSPTGFDEVIVYITYNDGSYETALYETSNTYGTVSYYSAFAGTVRLTQSAGVPQETNNIYFGDYMLVNDGSSVVLQASDSYTYSGSHGDDRQRREE